ncbi:WecB/TagA/CpsF family glycosyltransferase [Pseudomonas sp. KU43P]|uniref:WecB/TagA/CpsF family glycosyltransferase n=1 Tax=Pseudomonas sp. KU43P TaxID=2487887 RepID=UPI0012A94DC4|nr:WecB/TagA/CpsF family glycosyltransferase [Pseudomonas sp. KU43P]BBH45964.1 UDP-N-acetyl-D-mannosaminuronic acid transferase [Pseudomonas sp. KU43P]
MASSDWQGRWQAVTERMRRVADPADEQRVLRTLSTVGQPMVLGFVNAHALNLVARNADFHQSLLAADLLLRDGSGMAILFRRLALDPGLNMNGTDLIPMLLTAYQGRRVALWGSREPALSAAARRCEASFGVTPVSLHDGFAEVDTYLALARALQPELIILGMGMPKQEAVAARLASIGVPCLIVCGGAIIDFLGGKVTRAPRWLRRLGGEWIFRLMKEPKRLFMRYVVGNPMFIWRTLKFSTGPGNRVNVSSRRIRQKSDPE